MAQTQDVTVPDIGDFENVDVVDVLVKPGDVVTAEQPLITLESEKAALDVPAPEAGTVREVLVKVGDKVSQGTPIVRMEAACAATAEPAPNTGVRAGTRRMRPRNKRPARRTPHRQTETATCGRPRSIKPPP